MKKNSHKIIKWVVFSFCVVAIIMMSVFLFFKEKKLTQQEAEQIVYEYEMEKCLLKATKDCCNVYVPEKMKHLYDFEFDDLAYEIIKESKADVRAYWTVSEKAVYVCGKDFFESNDGDTIEYKYDYQYRECLGVGHGNRVSFYGISEQKILYCKCYADKLVKTRSVYRAEETCQEYIRQLSHQALLSYY